MNKRNGIGNGLNPKTSASGVKGKANVTATIDRVVLNRYFPGRLL